FSRLLSPASSSSARSGFWPSVTAPIARNGSRAKLTLKTCGEIQQGAAFRVRPGEAPEEKTMSRIGKQPITIPAGVKIAIANGTVKGEGPKGKLAFTHTPNMKVESDGKAIKVTRPDDDRQNRALHGLTRALINNMVVGVTKGYERKLKIEGVGFQAAAKGKGV